VIPEGLPEKRENWPPDLLNHLRMFRQGHLVEGLPFFYFANLTVPVHVLSNQPGEDGLAIIESDQEFPYGMIITQTCDIQEEDASRPRRPWVHICPVYRGDEVVGANFPRLDKGLIGTAKRNRVNYLVPLPGLLDGDWFADLRVMIPVEKGVLLTKTPIDGLGHEDNYVRLAGHLASVSGRPAFDGKFVAAVQRVLISKLKVTAGDEVLDEALHSQLLEFRVAAASLLDMQSIEIMCLSIGSVNEQVKAWLEELEDEIRISCSAAGISLTRWRVESADDITATEYRRSFEIPLADASPSDF
jgi:hypothetical protein